LVLAFSTVGLWTVTLSVARSTRKAAEHIPKVERAYLFLWHEVRRTITPNAGGALPGDVLRIEFAFHNHGKTPAILRRIEADIRVVEQYPATLRDVGANDMPPGLIVSGGTATPFLRRPQLIFAEQWQQVNRRERLLLFLGKVEYTDIFGEAHETGFCLEWFIDGFSPSPDRNLNYYT
jgi:hypothetical protein